MVNGTAQVSVDLDHGGRWTSLRMGGREWLWHRDEPRRAHVSPGDAFADAGGIEECVPTIRGLPDHGDAWSRSWHDTGDGAAAVRCDDFTLRRAIRAEGTRVTARYRLSADPGYRFVWAAHALLDVSPAATLCVEGRPGVRLYPEAAGFLGRPWPAGAPFATVRWPGPAGLRLDRLGPEDGSAAGAIVRDRAVVIVRDRGASLRMTLNVQAGSPAPRPSAPASIALWRNLGGFPDGRPYRSIGVEPMLGSVFDLTEAREPGDAVTVPAVGYVEWELEIEEVTVENATAEAAS
ncbi:MAG TPA: hypothetical protein VK817_23990 [Trebonia sp.]|nr:hypothetical protein [Trebonia sp.]